MRNKLFIGVLWGMIGLFSMPAFAEGFVKDFFSTPGSYYVYDYLNPKITPLGDGYVFENGTFTVSDGKYIVRDSKSWNQVCTFALKKVCVQVKGENRGSLEQYVITSGTSPALLIVMDGWSGGKDPGNLYTVFLYPYDESTGCYELNDPSSFEISRYYVRD